MHSLTNLLAWLRTWRHPLSRTSYLPNLDRLEDRLAPNSFLANPFDSGLLDDQELHIHEEATPETPSAEPVVEQPPGEDWGSIEIASDWTSYEADQSTTSTDPLETSHSATPSNPILDSLLTSEQPDPVTDPVIGNSPTPTTPPTATTFALTDGVEQADEQYAAPPVVENSSESPDWVDSGSEPTTGSAEYDLTPVLITSIGEDRGLYNDDSITNDNTLTLTGTGPKDRTIEILGNYTLLASVQSSSEGTWSAELPVLADGYYGFSARSTDEWGFVTEDHTYAEIDTTAPELQLEMPSLSLSSTPRVSVRLDSNDPYPIDGFSIDIDRNQDGVFSGDTEVEVISGNFNWTGEASYRLPELESGSYLVQARTTDIAGNEGIAQRLLRVGPVDADSSLSFEANRGQTNSQVDYLARGRDSTMFLTGTGMTFTLDVEDPVDPTQIARVPFGIEFSHANPNPLHRGVGEQITKSNYFIGDDPSNWVTGVENYSSVVYTDVYEGVDVVYSGVAGHLRHDFYVQPGANFDQISLDFTTADSVVIDEDGQLAIQQGNRTIYASAPVLYQETANGRVDVEGSFTYRYGQQIGFEVGAYDPTQTLVIDPTVVFSTFTGGNFDDSAADLVVDAAGNSHIVGRSASANFPVTNGVIQTTKSNQDDVVVVKFASDGTSRLFSTFLGGNNDDRGLGIALDSSGNIYVTGETESTNFTTTNGAFQTNQNQDDAFVSKLNSTGSSLLYSTYLGGNGNDSARDIAVDATGNAYVVGRTSSTNFPRSNGSFQGNQGQDDAFVTKLNASGTGTVYSTYLGGNGNDDANGIALDSSNNAYITGQTSSTNFPTSTGAFQTNQGRDDAYVTKLNAAGTGVVYSTYLGGGNDDDGRAIAVDSSGFAYVVGDTQSTNFPTTPGAAQTNNPLGNDAFVTKVSTDGTSLAYSTYLGGNRNENARGIALDASGNAYVTGSTNSDSFPRVNPLQNSNASFFSTDAYVTTVNATGSALIFSTHFGGLSGDSGQGIGLDSAGNIYVAGTTTSDNSFPDVNAIQTRNAGRDDMFLAKIDPVTTTPPPGGGGGGIPNPGGDQFEENQTSERATDFGNLSQEVTLENLTINRKTNGQNDFDWFRWTVASTGNVTATLNLVSGGDLELHLYTVSGNTLVKLGSTVSPGSNALALVHPVTAGQTILVHVKGRNSAPGVMDVGTYSLTVTPS